MCPGRNGLPARTSCCRTGRTAPMQPSCTKRRRRRLHSRPTSCRQDSSFGPCPCKLLTDLRSLTTQRAVPSGSTSPPLSSALHTQWLLMWQQVTVALGQVYGRVPVAAYVPGSPKCHLQVHELLNLQLWHSRGWPDYPGRFKGPGTLPCHQICSHSHLISHALAQYRHAI